MWYLAAAPFALAGLLVSGVAIYGVWESRHTSDFFGTFVGGAVFLVIGGALLVLAAKIAG